ncbi:MAG: SDR family oxidoreductase [Nitrospirae bacterium]|nr:SDR family oxidoreductase [Nitrospirota bacterium]
MIRGGLNSKHQNKVALITGGGSGIGFAITRALLGEGMRAAICGRDEGKLRKAEEELKTHPDNLLVMAADVSKRSEVDRWVKKVISQFGRIDVLVNNAGVARWSDIENITDEHLDCQLDVNLKGPLYCSQAVLPFMKKQQNGYIINISSVCGKSGFAGTAAYSASKFGLMALSDSLREEGAPSNIKVTAICPGFVATPMVTDAPVPLDEMIRPDDIAEAVLFLLNLSAHAAVREIVITRKEEG